MTHQEFSFEIFNMSILIYLEFYEILSKEMNGSVQIAKEVDRFSITQ